MRDLPVPTLLVVAGVIVGVIPGVPQGHVPSDAMLLGLLPPLLFAAAQELSLGQLRALWAVIAALATGLVAISAVVVAYVAHAAEPSIGVAVAFVLGAVVSSTDPVAVTALSRRLRLPERTHTLVQSESLFNDATSLVMFQVAVAAVTSGDTGLGGATLTFLRLGVGGAAIGAVLGWLAARLLRRERRIVPALVVDVAAPYAAAVLAHVADVSPVSAVIAAGLIVSASAHRSDPPARTRAVTTYGRAVRLLENAAFALIGYELAVFLRELPAGDRGRAVTLSAAVVGVLLVVRALAVGATAGVVARRGWGEAAYRPWQATAVVTWAGTRGVVPLVAALAIPATVDSGAAFPHRPLLLVVGTAAVVVTLVVQGTTLRPLVTRLGVVRGE